MSRNDTRKWQESQNLKTQQWYAKKTKTQVSHQKALNKAKKWVKRKGKTIVAQKLWTTPRGCQASSRSLEAR